MLSTASCNSGWYFKRLGGNGPQNLLRNYTLGEGGNQSSYPLGIGKIIIKWSVEYLVPNKVSSRAPLMVASKNKDLGTHREGIVAVALANIPYMSLDDIISAVVGTCIQMAHSASPDSSNE